MLHHGPLSSPMLRFEALTRENGLTPNLYLIAVGG
jgi:hypothetical protein